MSNVAKALLENWKVADEIVDAVAGHEDLDREARGPVTLTDVLSLAMLLDRNRNGAEMNVPGETLLKGLKRMQIAGARLSQPCSMSPRKKSRRSKARWEDRTSCPGWR